MVYIILKKKKIPEERKRRSLRLVNGNSITKPWAKKFKVK
jgi:hypothetical protein